VNQAGRRHTCPVNMIAERLQLELRYRTYTQLVDEEKS
jgi:hypothetical protein